MRILLNDIGNENNRNNIQKEYKEFISKSNIKNIISKDFHNFFINKENSFIIDIFYTQLSNVFTCICGYDTYSFQKNFDIPLYLPINNRTYKLIPLIMDNFKTIINDWNNECLFCKKRIKNIIKMLSLIC